jgi:hypothetical protein
MNARHAVAGLSLFAVMLLASAPVLAQSSQPSTPKVGGNDRFFLRFVEDAGIVPSYWLEGKASLQTNSPAFDPNVRGGGEADLLSLTPVFALNVAEDLEFGARVSLVSRDPDNGGRDTGLSDLDIWGKVSVVSDPVKVSLGILVSAPTGSKNKFLGTGETNVEFFGGIRKDFSRITLAGNVGLRINQDPDFPNTQIDGKNSILLGAGVLIPAGSKVVLSAEWAFETERFDGMKNDSRLMAGAQYHQSESLMYRGALGGGLSKGAPDFEVTGSAVWLF